jgi:hypothetical protein
VARRLAPENATLSRSSWAGATVKHRNQLRDAPSRSHDAVIRLYDDAGNLIETHEHAGDFKEQ